jgi:multiple sugar transport system permease protein
MATVIGDNHGLRLWTRYAVLLIVAVIFVFPLLFMVMSSLKPSAQLLLDTRSLRAFLPVGDLSLQNYADAFQRAPIGVFVFNSVLVTGVTVLLCLFVCSLAAFAFVFVDWTGKTIVFSILLATLIIPYETIYIPLLL